MCGWYRLLLLAALLPLLGACGGQLQRESLIGGTVDGGGPPAGPEHGAPVNPYLLHRESIPGAASEQFEQALAALARGDDAAAMAELLDLAENYPRLSGPRLNLALICRERGDTGQAERWFLGSIESNPYNLTARNQLGIFLREQGRFSEAEQVYLDALAVFEPYPETHRNIGVLYDLYMGRRELALQHFIRYQELIGGEDRVVAGWILDLERQLTLLVRGD